MASNLYNPGLEKLLSNSIDYDSDTIKVILVDTNHTFDKTDEFVSDIVANEASGTGYSRKTLANKSQTLDTANDRVEFDADNPTYTALDAGTIASVVIFKEVTNDADSPLIANIDFPDLVTNGSDVELRINSEGLFFVTNSIT
jgi:hypothetical protein